VRGILLVAPWLAQLGFPNDTRIGLAGAVFGVVALWLAHRMRRRKGVGPHSSHTRLTPR
jgi:Na+/glutamate symporter